MTDMEADLLIAQAEIQRLKAIIAQQNGKKCSFGEGVEVKIGGIPVDPCVYEVKEIHANVTVYVRQCTICGAVDISWERQEDTEDILEGDLNG